MGTVWRQFGCFKTPKCQMPTDRENNHTDRRQGTRTHSHAHTRTLRGYYSLLHHRNVRRAGPRPQGAESTENTRARDEAPEKKIDTSPFWCIEPPVRDIATTKEKDHITLHRHLRKRLDFYPGEARARRYNTGPPPVPPDMAGGLSAFAVQ